MQDLSNKIQLQFSCQQEVSKMNVGSDGKPFCSQCQRSLIDFRGKTLEETSLYIRQNEGCGIFDPQHVLPISESHPLILFSESRKYILALFTFLFAEQAYSQGDSPILFPKEESTIRWKDKAVPYADYKKKIEEGERKKEQEPPKEKARENEAYHNLELHRSSNFQYGVFVSKKFPFVSFRRRIIRTMSGFWRLPK